MSYVIRHHKADGSREYSHVDGDTATLVSRKANGAHGGIFVKTPKAKRYVAYNFNRLLGGSNLSKYDREQSIRRHLNELRSDYASSKGMSKKKTMMHVASIPPELWYSETAESGEGWYQDSKRLGRFIAEHGLRVNK